VRWRGQHLRGKAAAPKLVRIFAATFTLSSSIPRTAFT
jgi:hypothetical protein